MRILYEKSSGPVNIKTLMVIKRIEPVNKRNCKELYGHHYF